MFVCVYVANDAITSAKLFDGIPDAGPTVHSERYFNNSISNTPISFESNKILLSVFNIKTDLFTSLRYEILFFYFHQLCRLKNVEERTDTMICKEYIPNS